MAVFRVEHIDDYTVMSNIHLRDKNLSLKAKGLLSLMLSLPDDWEYTLTGLAAINRESKDAIRSAIHELEVAGYVRRRQTVDARGKFSRSEYIVYEEPQLTEEEPTMAGKPTEAEPLESVTAPTMSENTAEPEPTMTENATTETTTAGRATQINKDIQSKEKQNTDTMNPSFPFLQVSREEDEEEGKRKETSVGEMACYRELIQENIDYDALLCDHPEDRDKLDEVVELLTETVCSTKKSVRVGGNDYPAEVVRSRLLKLGAEHIR